MAKKRVRSSQQRARNAAETNDVVAAVSSDETVATTSTHTTETEPPVSEANEAVQVEDPTSERRSKRPRSVTPSETPLSQRATRADEDLCHACDSASPPSMAMHKCSSCQVFVHAHCYAIPTNALGDPAAWTCESCHDQSADAERACVFCLQAGHTCMRRIDTAHWPVAYRPADTDEQEMVWAHAMCALWNPFHQLPTTQATATGEPASQDLQAMDTETVTKTAQSPSKPMDRPSDPFRWRLELPVPSCSFCEGDHGVRIQCRRLNCGRFFHVRCAHASKHGFVQVVHAPFLLRHAYCDRHQQLPHPSIGDLATKLLSKTMASLVPRDVATKVQAIARRIDSYASIDAVLLELVHLLEEMCSKGFKASKTDPPTFSMRQLQALQLVLDHLPQLRNVYDPVTLSKTSATDLVHDADVVHALQKAFSPQRFVRKFAGPLSAFHQCDACHEPFQERQHVFYCVSSEQPHALHWKCTKRKSAPKDSSSSRPASAKKKSKSLSLVQQGHWTDIKLPKGLPSLGEGATCGVCRAAVDARGILAGRKEASRMDFEKPTSEFMYGGCFVNEMDPRSASAAGLRTSRATTATTAGQSGTVVGGLRVPGKSALRRSASGASATLDSDGEGSVALEPPKMDRINVRRTTRWVACLAQVIRLVLAAKKEAKEAETARLARENDEGMTEPTASGETVAAEPSPPEVKEFAASTDAGVLECYEEVGDVSGVTSGDAEMSGEAPTDNASPPAEATDIVSVGDAGSGEPSETCDRGMAPEEARREEGTEEKPTTSQVETPAVAEQELASASAPPSSLPAHALAYLEEAKRVVRPYDAYALSKMEAAHRMLDERNGPALSVLNTLIQEYTRFLYIKHTRAVAKATNEKRKRQELEAQEERERERKRIDREAEQALKKQMLAMRKKQRT